MTSHKRTQEPTPAELEVLKALWSAGESSAREVHERVADAQGWSYSTTRTVLSRMVNKGLVARRNSHGLALFAPAEKKVALISRMVRYFTQRVLELDREIPASTFADSKLLDEAEKAELRALLEEDGDEEK